MNTKILKVNRKNIETASCCLKQGGLVAFATETVYGLGANAFNDEAVKKIFIAKGRPSDNPLIVHLSGIKKIKQIAYIDKKTLKKIKRFMPGALTIVLKKRENISGLVSAGLDTVAIRIPKNKSALKLLKRVKLPIAAPSANSSTRPSPTLARHVYDDLNGKIEYILDGGRCEIGIESTILDFSTDKIRLLRKGGISKESLEKVFKDIEVIESSERVLSPGMKYKHYSPLAKVILFKNDQTKQIQDYYNKLIEDGKRVVIIDEKDVELYAKNLFYLFRQADKNGIEIILCRMCLDIGLGQSVNNRLIKAGKYAE